MSETIHVYIDERHFSNEIEVHEYIAEMLQFPTYYGATFASFADCLEDIYRNICITFICDTTPQDWMQQFISIAQRVAESHPSLQVCVSHFDEN